MLGGGFSDKPALYSGLLWHRACVCGDHSVPHRPRLQLTKLTLGINCLNWWIKEPLHQDSALVSHQSRMCLTHQMCFFIFRKWATSGWMSAAAAAAASSEVHELSQRSASPKKVTAQRSDQPSVINVHTDPCGDTIHSSLRSVHRADLVSPVWPPFFHYRHFSPPCWINRVENRKKRALSLGFYSEKSEFLNVCAWRNEVCFLQQQVLCGFWLLTTLQSSANLPMLLTITHQRDTICVL